MIDTEVLYIAQCVHTKFGFSQKYSVALGQPAPHIWLSRIHLAVQADYRKTGQREKLTRKHSFVATHITVHWYGDRTK